MSDSRPNVLYLMTDQQRFDTIAALNNPRIHTPNLDRLVRRGLSFTRAYSSCPVCMPARYNIRTGCEPPTIGVFNNGRKNLVAGQPAEMEDRCGPFLARRMGQLGYRTFGIGKFHAFHEDLGYEVYKQSRELYGNMDVAESDAYYSFIQREYPEFAHVEQLQGERTEMYYMPQTRVFPPEAGQEGWAARETIKQLAAEDDRPFFGFCSFIAPHPPFSPPVPFNRLYDPDEMPEPILGNLETDHADERIPSMNRTIWADDIGPMQARALKARYYGEVTYVDWCVGQILDALEARGDADNTLIAFFADHGDHLGDHHAWQKESYFEASCHVPLLVSWPARLPADVRREELVSLTDLFALATGAAGQCEPREGIDLLALAEGTAQRRDYCVGYYEVPGSVRFKVMVRDDRWKYIFCANGGRELLFDLDNDPDELDNRIGAEPAAAETLRDRAVRACMGINADRALEGGRLRSFAYQGIEKGRINQMAGHLGVTDFSRDPAATLEAYFRDRPKLGEVGR